MLDIFRDSPMGQCLRYFSGKQICVYPEDTTDFPLLAKYLHMESNHASQTDRVESVLRGDSWRTHISRADLEEKDGLKHILPSIGAERPAADTIIVDWYSDTDPENPMNWRPGKKGWVTLLLLAYVLAVYIGSSLYTASASGISENFQIGDVAVGVGLSMYVIGYGIGPMLFSPLSEIPAIGRNPPYIVGFLMFVILCVPAAVVDNFAGLLVLRFLLGFFGAPALSTAGASLGDFFSPQVLPYMILTWIGGATLGPALGPLIGGVAVQAKGWRWSFWELLWFSGPVLVVMLVLLPETSPEAILYRRAKRLRELTGRDDIRSAAEVKWAHMHASQVASDALIKPWEICAKDPAVLFTIIYTSLVYAIFYSFFESFPMVYQGTYEFSLSELGCAYLAVLVGVVIAVACYVCHQYFIAGPRLAKMSVIPPEEQLRPGLVATFCIPAGLFIFAWTGRSTVPWIASMVGISVSMIGIYTISQCLLSYLPFTYPRYAGSLFAASSFARSATAAAAILYSTPMFEGLGVAAGVSLLAGLTSLCTVGFYALFIFSPSLRKRSKFAAS